MRAGEDQHGVGVTREIPSQLVNGPVVPLAERDQVLKISRTTLGPVADMVDIREFGEGAAREPAALVSPGDLDPLSHRRIPAGPPLVENRTILALDGEHHIGVTDQPASDLGRDRPDALDLGHIPG